MSLLVYVFVHVCKTMCVCVCVCVGVISLIGPNVPVFVNEKPVLS